MARLGARPIISKRKHTERKEETYDDGGERESVPNYCSLVCESIFIFTAEVDARQMCIIINKSFSSPVIHEMGRLILTVY